MMKIRRLLISCLLDALLGDPLWLPHPVRIIGRAVKFSERLSSHFVKSQRGELITGALVSTFITAAAYTSTHL
ncbi:MAG: cobalamin biosynthesis protein, partial [Pyrinomonadaceae bacterium]